MFEVYCLTWSVKNGVLWTGALYEDAERQCWRAKNGVVDYCLLRCRVKKCLLGTRVMRSENRVLNCSFKNCRSDSGLKLMVFVMFI